MRRIVGGMFGLKVERDANCTAPRFLAKAHVLTSTARSGFALVVEHLRPSRVWMPSYLCDVLLKAVAGSIVRLYAIDSSLQIASDEWTRQVQPQDLVVFIDYFGFPTDTDLVKAVKQRQAWVLEDACQALLSAVSNPLSDFVLYSPRKFLGVPDGGVVIMNNGELPLPGQLPGPPPEWWLRAVHASVLRHEFDRFGGERGWYDLFQRVEASGPVRPCRMSELSQLLLRYHFDYRSIAERRKTNYQTLLQMLGEYALFGDLQDGVVPLGFPVRLRNRDEVRRQLFEENIYPPVHWTIDGSVPKAFAGSHKLSRQILTLVCDQRYDRSDMERMACVFIQEARQISAS